MNNQDISFFIKNILEHSNRRNLYSSFAYLFEEAFKRLDILDDGIEMSKERHSAYDDFNENQPRHCVRGMEEAIAYLHDQSLLIEKYADDLKQIPRRSTK